MPALVQVAQELPANRVGVCALTVEATIDAIHDGFRLGHVLPADHELIPIGGNFFEKRLKLITEPGNETTVVLEDEEVFHAVENRPLEDLPVGLQAAPRAAALPEPGRQRQFCAVDGLENFRPLERPAPKRPIP